MVMQSMSKCLRLGLAVTLALAGLAHAAGEPHVVSLSHVFDPDRAKQLEAMVERFNASDRGGRVNIVTDPAAEANAAIQIVQGDAEQALRKRGAYRPLYQVMAEAGMALGRDSALVPYDRDTTDSRGRRVALPVGMHTPVLFINRQAFTGAGLDPDAPPRTWRELQDALGKLFDAGQAARCPIPVGSWSTTSARARTLQSPDRPGARKSCRSMACCRSVTSP